MKTITPLKNALTFTIAIIYIAIMFSNIEHLQAQNNKSVASQNSHFKIKLFFYQYDFNAEKDVLEEVKDFQKTKLAEVCYNNVPGFITIEGTGTVTVNINDQDGKTLFKKENVNISSKAKISHESLIPAPGSNLIIKITQNNKTIFSGTVNPMGCN